MNKKEIKAFFQAIRNADLQKVKELVDTNKEYLTVCSFAPPKMDDGQSGLQVAFKTGNFEIAEFLIVQGADVNFIETSAINQWRAPALHDCLRATVFNCVKLQKDQVKFEKGLSLLKLMLDSKANPNAIDSYGNNCLNRAFMDVAQMVRDPEDFSNEVLLKQLRSVFKTLIEAGADIHQEHAGDEFTKRASFATQISPETWQACRFI